MTEIDVIMGMLDWNNSAEEQAAGLELAGRFSHPRKAAGFSELGGAPSGDRGKPSVRAGAWGRGMGGESQKTAKL